jgi:hypothetical protein
LNWTNISSSNFFDNNENRNGFTGVLTFDYHLDKKFNLGIDLLYVQKGFANENVYTDENGNLTGEKATSEFS